jgi:hypothetical protein
LLLALISCSSDKVQPKVTYKPGGIVINYTADIDLNFYAQSSHSVMLGIYQLNNINGFQQLSKDVIGTQKLLSLSKFDNSVEGVDSKFIYANESGQIVKQYQIPQDVSKKLTVNIYLNTDSIQELKHK